MNVDVVIIGAGISGASAAYFLSRDCSVAVIEKESAAGYHSTGRSAAIFTVGISALTMRRMAQASRSFLTSPPAGFTQYPLTSPRGSLSVAWYGQEAELASTEHALLDAGARAIGVNATEAGRLSPLLRRETLAGGIFEPDAMDIDVDLLLQGYLRGAKSNGAKIMTNAHIMSIDRQNGEWAVALKDIVVAAPFLVNAAGAWADQIATMAGLRQIGLSAYRRTAFTFAVPNRPDLASWPHTSSAAGNWYIKPDAGRLMGSLADETDSVPCDAQPEDVDVAQGIYNIEQDTTLTIARPERTWAGLRSFVSDRNPVAGFDLKAEGFFWLCGQGGCGVLTSPSMGQATAAILRGQQLPQEQIEIGLEMSNLAPDRLATAS